jgi:uncharacterized membrane protein YdjX (TVP38/TMEM64 family)
MKNPWVRLIVALFFFAAVYVMLKALRVDYSHVTPQIVRNKILSFGVWAPVMYIVFYSLRVLVLFPAGVLTIVGGLTFGPLFGTVYTVIGATLCAVIEFFIARFSGRQAFAKFLKGKLAAIDKSIETNSFKTVLLIRLIPNVAYDIQNYSLGLTGVKVKDYILATMLGIIPGTVAFAFLGHSLTDLRNVWKIMTALFIIVVIYFVQYYFRKKRTI